MRTHSKACLSLVLSLLVISDCHAGWGANVTVRVDAGQPVRTMLGGFGASWHAIDTPIPNGKGGSAWGGYPPAEDEAAWQSLYRRADWLCLDWCRVELEQRMY